MQAWWEAQSAELQEEKIERAGEAMTQLEDEHPRPLGCCATAIGTGCPLKPLPPRSWSFLERELSQTEKHRIAQQLYRARKQFQEIFEKI